MRPPVVELPEAEKATLDIIPPGDVIERARSLVDEEVDGAEEQPRHAGCEE